MANNLGVKTGTDATIKTTDTAGVHVTHHNIDTIASVPSHAVTNAGTFATQSAQSGTWTVQPGNTANTTAWKVDGSAVTQPISSTALTNINTALGSTALDRGVGAGGVTTLRTTIDSAQIPTAGAQLTSASVPVNLATDAKYFANAYETVAASQTAQALGATGATGDWISHLVVVPATTSPGNVLLLDNATSIIVFTGGASSVTTLHPFTIDLRMVSASGAWKVTTGANVSVIGVGKFT